MLSAGNASGYGGELFKMKTSSHGGGSRAGLYSIRSFLNIAGCTCAAM
jgi:hypothetical protein